MAQPVHLRLEIDGNSVDGESSIGSMEREGTIECSSFKYSVFTPFDGGRMTGKRQHNPVEITKRIDKSTPLLFKALCQNDPVTMAEFRFFRPATGRTSGGEQHFFTVLLENGYISRISQVSEDAMGGENAPPMMEEVAFVFQDITWTYEIGGATHKDSWRGE